MRQQVWARSLLICQCTRQLTVGQHHPLNSTKEKHNQSVQFVTSVDEVITHKTQKRLLILTSIIGRR